jgi:hypothetical protein
VSRLREKVTISVSLPSMVGAAVATVTLAWAVGVTAAEHVMGPHLAESKVRVEIMCAWARDEIESRRAICDAVGAKCPPSNLKANPLLRGCEGP